MRDLGPRPPPVSPLEDAKKIFSIAIFSVTATDSAAVLSASGAALGSLTSAPDVRGPLCQIWGRGSPNQNFTFFDPEIFCGISYFPKFYISGAVRPLFSLHEIGQLWPLELTLGGANLFS